MKRGRFGSNAEATRWAQGTPEQLDSAQWRRSPWSGETHTHEPAEKRQRWSEEQHVTPSGEERLDHLGRGRSERLRSLAHTVLGSVCGDGEAALDLTPSSNTSIVPRNLYFLFLEPISNPNSTLLIHT